MMSSYSSEQIYAGTYCQCKTVQIALLVGVLKARTTGVLAADTSEAYSFSHDDRV